MVFAAVFTIARKKKKPSCPSLMKIWYMITIVFYSGIKRNEIIQFIEKWIELENTVLG